MTYWCVGAGASVPDRVAVLHEDVGAVSVFVRRACPVPLTLNNWDVSNVTDMEFMFYEASSFNQPLHAPWYVVEQWEESDTDSVARGLQIRNSEFFFTSLR